MYFRAEAVDALATRGASPLHRRERLGGEGGLVEREGGE
jgi:hypothetical protein